MWKKISEIALQLFDLTRTVGRHTSQISELQKQVDEMQQALDRFALVYQKDREREKTERENLELRLENALLKQELARRPDRKQLPAGTGEDQNEDAEES